MKFNQNHPNFMIFNYIINVKINEETKIIKYVYNYKNNIKINIINKILLFF